MSTRGLTIAYDQAKPPNTDEAMDLNVLLSSATVPNDYYYPNGLNPAGVATNSTIATGGKPWVAGRNYTVTNFIAKYNAAPSNNFEIWHLFINGVDSGAQVQVASGQVQGTTVGLSKLVATGDELVWNLDAGANASTGFVGLSMHLEPR